MTESPALQSLRDAADVIRNVLPQSVLSADVVRDELIVRVKRDDIIRVLLVMRDDPRLSFSQLSDLCGVDYPTQPERFEVVYNLLSMSRNQRCRVKVTAAEGDPVPSVVSIHPCANWLEREVWDLYGVFFSDHPDLRRILTDYGFEGHPLRKDFPLTGYVEVRYDEQQKRVIYEPVKLTQDFRTFDFLSPWEGIKLLPGDEKAQEKAQAPKAGA
jgi:NADH-quinone oxidoreductase subunit C